MWCVNRGPVGLSHRGSRIYSHDNKRLPWYDSPTNRNGKQTNNQNLNTMKNTLKIMVLLLVAATMAAMTSCNKQPQVYGKWTITEVSVTIGGESFDYFDEFYNEAVVGHTVEFRKDGTAIADDNEEDGGYYTLKGDKMIIKDGIRHKVNDTVKYYDMTGTITTLTETNMTIDFLNPAELNDIGQDVHSIMGFVRE